MLFKILDRFEYDSDRIIGTGGMGVVYHGLDTQTDHPVAIKLLATSVTQHDPTLLSRFQREGKALRALNHPNIVGILATAEEKDGSYLVMDYVDGGSLRDLLDQEHALSIQRTIYIALDLTDALIRAHRLNILHRDIKPGNILMAADGTPRLTDFGVARTEASDLTQEGRILGTIAYMSPESFTQKHPIDERHDIWAFGIVMYEMLTGTRPFDGENISHIIQAILHNPVPNLEVERPDIPIALIDFVYRMLEKDPNSRIHSVRQIGVELEAIMYEADSIPQQFTSSIGVSTTNSLTSSNPLHTTTLSDTKKQLHNFPTLTTPFVGRTREITEISQLIKNPDHHIITLLGPGGAGKTRLAIEVGQKLADDFNDGVTFIPLESVEDPDLVPSEIAEALNFPMSGGQDLQLEIVNFLREKEMLLIIDNLEHLIDGVKYISKGMERMPKITILVTTRERLRLRGEHLYDVNNMIIPPRQISAEELAEYPSAQLFVSNATHSMPDFKINETNAPHIAHIINLVHGMPLAIELATGWLEMLSLEEIAYEIEQSLDFLETNMRDMPERHRSVRAVFEYSWNLLTDQDRDAFMTLSIFRAGFDREAAQKVTGESLRTLISLSQKSLLFRDPNGNYKLHSLLRQFAEELFETKYTKKMTVINAYIDYYRDLVVRFYSFFLSPKEKDGVKQFEMHNENIRHSWQLAVEHVRYDAIDTMLHPFILYFLSTGNLQEASRRVKDLIDHLESDGLQHEMIYWRLQNRYALLLGRVGQPRQSEAIALKVMEHFREIAHREELIRTLNILCYCQMVLGDYAKSREYAHQARDMLQSEGDEEHYAQTMGNLGYLEYLDGNLELAKSIYDDLLSLTKRVSPVGYAFAQNNLGEVVRAMGDFDGAADLYQQAYDTFKRYKHLRGMAFTLSNLAGINSVRGQLDQAKEMHHKSYKINKEIGDQIGIGHSLSAMGNIAYAEQDFKTMQTYYQQALQIREESEDYLGIIESLADLGIAFLLDSQYVEARIYFEKVLENTEFTSANQRIKFISHIGLSRIAQIEGDLDQAIQYWRVVFEFHQHDSKYMIPEYTLILIAATSRLFFELEKYQSAALLFEYVQQQEKNWWADIFITYLLTNIQDQLEQHLQDGYHDITEAARQLTESDVIAIMKEL